ncbi:MAG: hypothetical protein ACRDP8_08205 [Actinopolymorphaceae bacterium]
MPQLPRPGAREDMPNGRAGQMLWYGGLAAVAALGVVEWPVAAVVAAGSYLVDRRVRASQQGRSSVRKKASTPSRAGSTTRRPRRTPTKT